MISRDRVTSFHLFEPTLSPDQLYISFKNSFPEDKKHHYITGPINSGGARRRHSFEGLKGEQITQLINIIAQENIRFANSLLNMLLRMQLVAKNSIVTSPYHLGERFHTPKGEHNQRAWNEVEYLLFWSMIISGVKVEVAADYYHSAEQQIKNRSAKVNARELPREQRIDHYRAMEEVVQKNILDLPRDSYRPIDLLIKFPDSNLSLGSILEQRLATSLQVPQSVVVFNTAHPYKSLLSLYHDVVFKCLEEAGSLPVKNNDQAVFPIAMVPSQAAVDYI